MTASVLVYLVHADPMVQPRYVASSGADVVALVGPPVPDLPGGGLSARYDALAASCKALTKGRSAIEGLVMRYKPPRPLSDYEHVILATYSAGYGFARGLTALDRAMLSGLVLIDSGHGPEGLRGAALDWLIPWAKSAREGRKVLAIGHSDVDPVTYASTTEVAEAAIVHSGGPLAELSTEPGAELGLKRRRREGTFVVEAYDRRPAKDAKLEHGDALTVWGDELVAQACAMAAREPASMLMGVLAPIGRALASAGRLVADAFASDGATAAELDQVARGYSSKPVESGVLSHGYRCSVAELCADAKALGKLHLAADVRAGRYFPLRGDLVISARAGGDPLLGGSGHVERVVVGADHPSTLECWTIGGNEGNTWHHAPYDFRASDFRAVIAVDPRIGWEAVEIAMKEHRASVKEKPGAKHEPRIQAYHAGARRGGSPLAGMPGHELEGGVPLGDHAPDEVAWCASAASWCAYQAAKGLS
ncbi:MAG: hypothetical protein HOW73_45445 [Polyangiaceae bacterium]|nr:hypothetical protein [Polyangiaceae bacterium]